MDGMAVFQLFMIGALIFLMVLDKINGEILPRREFMDMN